MHPTNYFVLKRNLILLTLHGAYPMGPALTMYKYFSYLLLHSNMQWTAPTHVLSWALTTLPLTLARRRLWVRSRANSSKRRRSHRIQTELTDGGQSNKRAMSKERSTKYSRRRLGLGVHTFFVCSKS